jgi:hypothetical protein
LPNASGVVTERDNSKIRLISSLYIMKFFLPCKLQIQRQKRHQAVKQSIEIERRKLPMELLIMMVCKYSGLSGEGEVDC